MSFTGSVIAYNSHTERLRGQQMRSWNIKDRGYSLSSHPHLLSVHHSSLNKICSFLLARLYPGQFSWLECTLYFHTSEPYLFSGLAHIEPAPAKLLNRFSHVRLCATPWMAAHQASPSLGFSRDRGAWWATIYGVAQSRT